MFSAIITTERIGKCHTHYHLKSVLFTLKKHFKSNKITSLITVGTCKRDIHTFQDGLPCYVYNSSIIIVVSSGKVLNSYSTFFIQSSNKTPLIEAARSGSISVVRAILTRGGQVNAMDKNKRTAIHHAAMNGHFDVVRLLASYGADLNMQDVIGNNMIHYAAEGGFANCLKYLSQRGRFE